MTFAAAALTPAQAVVVADTQQVDFVDGGVHVRRVVKTVAGRCAVGVSAGVTSTRAGSVTDVLRAAVAEPRALADAVRVVVDGAAALLGPVEDWLVGASADGDVVWQAALCGRWADGDAMGIALTAYVEGGRVHLDPQLLAVDERAARVVILGARHLALAPLDFRYARDHEALAWGAALTRMPVPPAPVTVPCDGVGAELTARVEHALASQSVADRPAWWPADLPVAGGDVTCAAVSLV